MSTTILTDAAESGHVAFEALYDTYRTRIYQRCYQLLGQREDAEDALSQTFYRAWRAWDRRTSNANLYAWLYTIATRICYDLLRSRTSHFAYSLDVPWDDGTRTADGVLFFGETLEERKSDMQTHMEQREVLARCLPRLKCQEREMLLALVNYSRQEIVEQICARRGVQLATAYRFLQQARASFLAIYQQEYAEEAA